MIYIINVINCVFRLVDIADVSLCGILGDLCIWNPSETFYSFFFIYNWPFCHWFLTLLCKTLDIISNLDNCFNLFSVWNLRVTSLRIINILLFALDTQCFNFSIAHFKFFFDYYPILELLIVPCLVHLTFLGLVYLILSYLA